MAGRVACAEHHHSRPDHRFKANPGRVDISRNPSDRSVGGKGVKVTWLSVLFTPLFTLVLFLYHCGQKSSHRRPHACPGQCKHRVLSSMSLAIREQHGNSLQSHNGEGTWRCAYVSIYVGSITFCLYSYQRNRRPAHAARARSASTRGTLNKPGGRRRRRRQAPGQPQALGQGLRVGAA